MNSFLESLLNSHSPSGYEQDATKVFAGFCNDNKFKYEFEDSIGNVAYSVGEGKIPFMLSGHIDEIALQVQYIDDKGFIYFIKDGGVDPKVMPGSIVKILSGDNVVIGVIGKTPIHIEARGEGKDKVTKLKDLKIDIGATNKLEAEKLVSIGDPIVFEHPHYELLNDHIVGGSIDDKVGVYVTAMVLKNLAESKHEFKNLKVYGVACTQEEVGGHGATIAAKRINPRYSIDYDVTFATDDNCVNNKEWGDIKLGAGGCIAYGPDKNNDMCKMMVDVCVSCMIPHQSFAVGAGMTNTLKIKLASDNCKTLLLSIPERNMHTPVEICSLKDLDSLIEMTTEFIIRLDTTMKI